MLVHNRISRPRLPLYSWPITKFNSGNIINYYFAKSKRFQSSHATAGTIRAYCLAKKISIENASKLIRAHCRKPSFPESEDYSLLNATAGNVKLENFSLGMSSGSYHHGRKDINTSTSSLLSSQHEFQSLSFPDGSIFNQPQSASAASFLKFIHICFPKNGDDKRTADSTAMPEFFVFADGCLVSWASKPEWDWQFVMQWGLYDAMVEPFFSVDNASFNRQHEQQLIQPMADQEQVEFRYSRGSETAGIETASDLVLLPPRNDTDASLATRRSSANDSGSTSDKPVFYNPLSYGDKDLVAKLAFSHGMVRSVQLGVLENLLSGYLDSIQNIPRYMMSTGHRPAFKPAELMKKHGQLLYIRGLLNLHSDLVDASAPDWYSCRPDLERYFLLMSSMLECRPRIRVLNQRLDHASSLIQMMQDDLNWRHANRMEWTIISLIGVEVLFEFVHYWDRYLGGSGS